MCTLLLGYSNFPNILMSFETPWIPKCDMNEVQKLKYRHSLGVEHTIRKYHKYICHLTKGRK